MVPYMDLYEQADSEFTRAKRPALRSSKQRNRPGEEVTRLGILER